MRIGTNSLDKGIKNVSLLIKAFKNSEDGHPHLQICQRHWCGSGMTQVSGEKFLTLLT